MLPCSTALRAFALWLSFPLWSGIGCLPSFRSGAATGDASASSTPTDATATGVLAGSDAGDSASDAAVDVHATKASGEEATVPLGDACDASVACTAGAFCVNDVCCVSSSCPQCGMCGSDGGCMPSPVCEAPFNEYPVPDASVIVDITVGADENLWFTDSTNSKIGRMNPATGALDEFPVSGRAQAITNGPDGNLWFTESTGANKVGHMTTDGTGLVEIQASGVLSVDQIIPGPSGGRPSVWFTERDSNLIGTIDIGVLADGGSPLTEFQVMNETNCEPTGIAVGPDGNIWFTEAATGKVARMTPDGRTFTEYGITMGAMAGDMVVAPDGTIWFTEYGTNKIGSITIIGGSVGINETLLTSGAAPEFVTIGADQNVWFTESGSNTLAWISNGIVTETPMVPTPTAGLGGIVSGPDGNLWFTEYSVGQIGTYRLCCAH